MVPQIIANDESSTLSGEMEKAALERRREHEQDQAADDFLHGPTRRIGWPGRIDAKGDDQ
jgi:hypothetical protein